MNTGKRKFASNLMAIIWFIIYLMPVMTFGFYSLGNIGDNKLYKDDIFSVTSPSISVKAGDVLISSCNFIPDLSSASELTPDQLDSFIDPELVEELFNHYGTGSHPYITIDNISYYYLFTITNPSDLEFFIVFTSLTTDVIDYPDSDTILFSITLSFDNSLYNLDVSHFDSFDFVGTVDFVLPYLLYTEPIYIPSFIDKTFAQFGYDSNNLDIVGQSIVDFGELVNFNGLTATSPATFFIWWFFLVTIVRLLFECVAFLPKLAVKWLHYFSRE